MLNKVFFDGFVVTSSSFKEISLSDKGFFNITIQNIKYVSEKNDDETEAKISMSFDVDIKGYSGNRNNDPKEEDLAFKGGLQIETFFNYESEAAMDDDQVEENMWFFDRFNQVAMKLAIESIIKNSNLDFLPVPWNNR